MSEEKFGKTSCLHCGQHIEFPIEVAGNKVECPQCAGEIILGVEPLQTTVPVVEITAAELKTAFEGSAPRCRISVFYQAGLLLVAWFMILLPLAYLAFAGFAGYCVYWYALHARAIFSGPTLSVHLMILKIIVYIGPIAGGAVAVFFMFKPLLARRSKRAEPVELNPAQHPRLYQLIAHVSDLLTVGLPKRIYLDCTFNASAGFRRGWVGFLGNNLVLTIGLPLAAGLNTRQFAAVMGHELGHCTQALAMRLGFVIDSIDRWFMRVVYERDTRTIVLLICLDQLLVPGGLQDWLGRRRSDLDGESPVGLIKRGEWAVLADLIDDMLTGAPS